MRNIKYLCIIIITVIIFSTINYNTSNALKIKDYNVEESTSFEGYIIQFNEESILEFIIKIKTRIKNYLLKLSEKIENMIIIQNIKNHKNHLLSIHKNTIQNISRILEKNNLSTEIFLREFVNVFNGISIKNISYEIVNTIKDLPFIRSIIPNYRISVALDKSTTLINADDLWKIKDTFGRNITGQGITIAILDTGVDYTHPDLKDNYIQQGSYDIVNNDTDPMDEYGHGTHCAGIICGKGISSDFQYVGVAPDAKYFAIKILNENGDGNFETFLLGIEKALDPNGDGDYSDHADIISLSFGTDKPGRPDDQFCKVVDNIVDIGVIVVAAAGNLGPGSNTITSPGCARQSICVGSTDKQDIVATSSSRGPVEWNGNYMIKPDIVAPGVSITSTKNGGGYVAKSGTSMATPHVAGAAALILQANPDYTPEKVKKILMENAKNLGYESNTQGNGRLDVLNVLKEDTLYIDAPYEIIESDWFKVKITDRNGTPIKSWVLINFPYHLPKLKYGSSVTFKAPIIFNQNKGTIKGKISVFKVDSDYGIIKKDILILNKK